MWGQRTPYSADRIVHPVVPSGASPPGVETASAYRLLHEKYELV